LWRLHDGRGYADLLESSIVVSDDERQARVIGLEDLIGVKERAGRPRDRVDVRYLRRVRVSGRGGDLRVLRCAATRRKDVALLEIPSSIQKRRLIARKKMGRE